MSMAVIYISVQDGRLLRSRAVHRLTAVRLLGSTLLGPSAVWRGRQQRQVNLLASGVFFFFSSPTRPLGLGNLFRSSRWPEEGFFFRRLAIRLTMRSLKTARRNAIKDNRIIDPALISCRWDVTNRCSSPLNSYFLSKDRLLPDISVNVASINVRYLKDSFTIVQ